MDKAERQIRELQIRKTMENLRKNRMEAFYVPTAAEVPEQVASLLNVGDTVAVGGSMTLFESGIISLLEQRGDIHYLDRYRPGITPESSVTVPSPSPVMVTVQVPASAEANQNISSPSPASACGILSLL